ncbi:leucine-rich repeats (6 copies)-containing protein [Trichomonas vaginalis G3]|uniref:leucine-rich repeats (6 copies)-containing protein n=1 Tax=Trichomonas vaginalis (strain ATCC PRA-98 / G3) TaxID=412133 RepID=UPI0021E57474|nr:leucine-rich repeats (6 copies)-containing protein [Trichomonas vaginalis G3]KAI5493702.1 leucine-rich repeats (6 copies)-containing protein [Trichomonas vaginalis G3]
MKEFYYCGDNTSVDNSVLEGSDNVKNVFISSSFGYENFAGKNVTTSDVCGSGGDDSHSKTVKITIIVSISVIVVIAVVVLVVFFAFCRRNRIKLLSSAPLITSADSSVYFMTAK